MFDQVMFLFCSPSPLLAILAIDFILIRIILLVRSETSRKWLSFHSRLILVAGRLVGWNQKHQREYIFFNNLWGYSGGQTGIRTLETVSRLHTFQACAFDHSDTCPLRVRVYLQHKCTKKCTKLAQFYVFSIYNNNLMGVYGGWWETRTPDIFGVNEALYQLS